MATYRAVIHEGDNHIMVLPPIFTDREICDAAIVDHLNRTRGIDGWERNEMQYLPVPHTGFTCAHIETTENAHDILERQIEELKDEIEELPRLLELTKFRLFGLQALKELDDLNHLSDDELSVHLRKLDL